MKEKGRNYYLYRIFNIDFEDKSFQVRIYQGEKSIRNHFNFISQTFKASLKSENK
jgi:hypothetical protein